MSDTISSLFGTSIGQLFGGQSKAQKAAAAAQALAQQTQQRQGYAAQENAAQLSAEQVASGRRLRGLGRQALAFQGNTLGVLPDLSAGSSTSAAAGA